MTSTATFQAGRLALLLSLVLLSQQGCTRYYSFQVFPEGAPPDTFPQIKSRAQLSVSGSEAGVELRVFYAPGEEQLAETALEEAKKAPRFIHEATGLTASTFAGFYLYPLPEDGHVPYYSPRGPGSYTGVFVYRKGEPLMAILENREWLHGVYPHELAHSFLDSVRPHLDDRWLADGLPEYLTAEFSRQDDPELPRGEHRLPPALIALSRAKLGPWDMSDYNAFAKRLRTDEALAGFLAEQMTWRYAAAEELTRRWLAKAREEGIGDPLRDLLARVRDLGKAVDWNAVQKLARMQTGRSFEELARVSNEELSAAQAQAWRERADENLGTRVHALAVLAEVGLPKGATAQELLPAFSIPAESSDVRLGWAWQILQFGGQAVAWADDPAVAAKVVELAHEQWGEDGYKFVPPELWRVVAATNRQLALQQLAATVVRSDASLSIRNRANDALKTLTGQDVGWSIEASPVERQKAAARWQAEISTVGR